MLEKILRLYVMSMHADSRSPTPHLFGPPGCGKSSSVKEAADLLGVQMHTINVSRISPLELEGVQMPVTTQEEMRLKLLHATFWTQLREGDILLLDEFLRGFPEVYNGLLDILTAREVGGYVLPRVFIIAASNSVVTYDKALEDRLLHLPVTDPRKNKAERERTAKLIADKIGLMPEVASSMEMEELLREDVLPMYAVLDNLTKRASPPVTEGVSVRNLVGQAELREIQTQNLQSLIDLNNNLAVRKGRFQYVVVTNGTMVDPRYLKTMYDLRDNPKLTPLQRRNTIQNIELIELAAVDRTTEGVETLDD